MGIKVVEFEKKCVEYLNVNYVIGVGNGIDVFVIVFESVGIGKGDEVIIIFFIFFVIVEVIVRVGVRLVFVDIDFLLYNIDFDKIEEKIIECIKVIIFVYIFGYVCDMKKIV